MTAVPRISPSIRIAAVTAFVVVGDKDDIDEAGLGLALDAETLREQLR